MQRKFHKDFGKLSMDKAVSVINPLVEKFREKQAPVVWIQHESQRMSLTQGEGDFELLKELLPEKGEKIFIKKRGSGFLGTDLESYLREKKIEEVYFCGYAAEGCVNKTYKGGKRLGFSVYKVRDAIASGSFVLLWIFDRIGRYRKSSEILS